MSSGRAGEILHDTSYRWSPYWVDLRKVVETCLRNTDLAFITLCEPAYRLAISHIQTEFSSYEYGAADAGTPAPSEHEPP